jgi:hypothetical protein
MFQTDGQVLSPIEISQQDLASFTVTTHETVFRIMQEFNQWTAKTGRSFCLLQPIKLQQLLKEISP